MMVATPTHLSRIPRGTDLSAADVGATMLGLGLFRQGYNIVGVLEAKGRDGLPLYPEASVLVPRRSQKTTAIWATLLGRCATRPGHKVATTAQDGNRARKRWAEVARAIEPRAEELGVKIRWSNGDESFEWSNGSRLWVVPPNAGAFRGEAADDLLFDEAGELSIEKSEDLLAGALPLLDTRPMGQAIIAGTPSKARAGLLWDALQAGRERRPGHGIVDYSIRDDEPSVLIDDDGTVRLNEPVLKRVHPGIGTLTTMAKMRSRFDKMQVPQFEMEYLCRFPADNTTHAIDPERWSTSKVEPVERPARVGIAFDCAYDGSSASLVYVWRDAAGIAYAEVVAHRAGTSWVPSAAHKAGLKYRGQLVGYDNIGSNIDPGTAMNRLRPAVRTRYMNTKEIMAAAQRLVSEIHEDRFRHFGQPDLDAAVGNVTWRDVLRSGRAFGAKVAGDAAINPIVAVSIGLWMYDKGRDRAPIAISAG